MNEAKATRYQRRRRRAEVWALVVSSATLAGVALTPLSHVLRDWAWRLASAWPPALAPVVALGLFTSVIVVLWELSFLPARTFRTAAAEPSSQSTDAAVARAITFAAGALVVWVAAFTTAGIAYIAASAGGEFWWLIASVLVTAVLFAALKVGPHLLASVARVRPLSRPDLVRAVAAVADVARVPVAGVHEWLVGPGSHASALITGLGRGRRVLVASDLVRHWSDDEVAVVVAHELGHVARHDLARAVALSASIITVGFAAAAAVLRLAGPRLGLGGAGDLAAFPLIALVAGACWIVSAPIRHAQSRRQERHADAFALACTGEAAAFASALRRLSAERLAEDRPSLLTTWLFHGHPPVAERLAAAERHVREEGRPDES